MPRKPKPSSIRKQSSRKKSVKKEPLKKLSSGSLNKPVKSLQKHWRDMAPMTRSARSKMPSHCFLDPDHLKYPICEKNSEKISCQGITAAKKRATLQRNDVIKYKATRMAKAAGC